MLIASVKRLGEKYHKDALELSKRIIQRGHEGICSALLLIELPGALASSTAMPLEKISDVEVSAISKLHVSIMPYEPHVNRAIEPMLEFRDLEAEWEIGSADFHHLSTSHQEGCDFFVTTDVRHLLRPKPRRPSLSTLRS